MPSITVRKLLLSSLSVGELALSCCTIPSVAWPITSVCNASILSPLWGAAKKIIVRTGMRDLGLGLVNKYLLRCAIAKV